MSDSSGQSAADDYQDCTPCRLMGKSATSLPILSSPLASVILATSQRRAQLTINTNEQVALPF